jgi:hypothetical protein
LEQVAHELLHGGVGGPIDKQHPREEHAFAEFASSTGARVRLVTAIWGDHHAGEPFGITTQSEIGIAFNGAKSRDG